MSKKLHTPPFSIKCSAQNFSEKSLHICWNPQCKYCSYYGDFRVHTFFVYKHLIEKFPNIPKNCQYKGEKRNKGNCRFGLGFLWDFFPSNDRRIIKLPQASFIWRKMVWCPKKGRIIWHYEHFLPFTDGLSRLVSCQSLPELPLRSLQEYS